MLVYKYMSINDSIACSSIEIKTYSQLLLILAGIEERSPGTSTGQKDLLIEVHIITVTILTSLQS
jgi:hypothetical protein